MSSVVRNCLNISVAFSLIVSAVLHNFLPRSLYFTFLSFFSEIFETPKYFWIKHCLSPIFQMYKCDLKVRQTTTIERFDDRYVIFLQLNESKIGTGLILRIKNLHEEAPIFHHQMNKFRFPQPIINLNR